MTGTFTLPKDKSLRKLKRVANTGDTDGVDFWEIDRDKRLYGMRAYGTLSDKWLRKKLDSIKSEFGIYIHVDSGWY